MFAWIIVKQEALESSAFPDKIYKIKNLQIDEGFYVFQNYAKVLI